MKRKKKKKIFTVTQFLFLTFQLCNMFACIVEDTQIILYHIFIVCQQNMVQTILFIVDKTLSNPELILCAEVFLYNSVEWYFHWGVNIVPNFLFLSCG